MKHTAHDIARLARAAASLDEAAALIQNFADRTASTAAVRAIESSHQSVSRVLDVLFESPLSPRDQRKQLGSQ